MSLFQQCSFAPSIVLSVIAKNANDLRTAMKSSTRLLFIGGAAMLALAIPGQAFAATCPSGFNGWYGLSVNGSSSGNPKYLTGAISLSACQIVGGDITVSENGVTTTLVSPSGSYISNSDGTVTFTITPQGGSTETYNIGYSPTFNEALGVEVDASAIASIDLKAQIFPKNASWHYQYNNSLMRGGWVASCSGTSGTFSDLNYFEFDGSGNLFGFDRTNGFGSFADNTYNGSYSMTPDGEFTGSLVVAGNNVSFSGVMDNDLTELQYIYYNPSHGFDFCTAKLISTDRAPVAGQ